MPSALAPADTDRYTHDILFGGAIRMKQRKDGYRHSIDPVLLAHFVTPGRHDRVLDIGTGSGIIPLILAHRHPEITVTGIEIQPGLADTATINVHDNNLEHRISILAGDALELTPKGFPRQNLILSNPPYTPCGKGRTNPSGEKAIARHEAGLTLNTLVATAASLLADHGRFAVIYPESRCDELLDCIERHGLAPVRLRRVHPLKTGPAKRVLLEAVKGKTINTVVEPPLIIFMETNEYNAEIKSMFL